MAQVKKFQPGGKLTINGKDYTIDQLNEYMNSGGFSSQERAALAGTIQSIANGASRTFDRNANSISGEGVTDDFTGFYGSEKRAERNQGRSTRWANRQARRNSDHHIVNSALERLGGIEDYYNKSKESESKTKLGRGSGWFDRDESGNYISGPSNLEREAYIRRVYDYLGGNTNYDLSGWDNQDTLNGLTHYYKSGMTAEDLISSIKSGNLESDQIDALKAMGFIQSEEQAAETKANQTKSKLRESGYDFDGADVLLTYDNDGNLIATDAMYQMLGGDSSKNYWLNDIWAGLSNNGVTNPYGDLQGHVIINGRVYKQDDPFVLQYMQENGFVDANKNNDFSKADSIIQSTWGQPISMGIYDSSVYSPWAHSKKGLRYRGISGYDLGNENHQLIEYYDDSDNRNQYGLVDKNRYAILDQYGNLVLDDVDLSKYSKTGDVTASEVKFQKRQGSEAGRLAGTVTNIGQADNSASSLFIHKNPDTGAVFIQDEEMRGDQKGHALQLPKEVSDLIPDGAWDYFRTNKSAKSHLLNAIRDLTGSKWKDLWTNFPRQRLINDFTSALTKEGVSNPAEQARQIVETLERYTDNDTMPENWLYGTSRDARRATFLTNPVAIERAEIGAFKTGGKITKHQYGHLIGENKGTTGVTAVRKLDKPVDNVSKSIGLGSKDSKQWSGLDTAELAALVADLGALGVTLVDPTNVGGVVAGVAGSTANLVADVKRDGFQFKDLGSYGLNLAMDLGTILPIAGDAISGAKTIRAMKKAAPLLAKAIKLGAIAGVSDAVYNTVDKIAKGESFTISDVRRIVNGISGGITLGKTGLFNKTSKTVKSDPGLFKGKNKSDDIKLSKSEIESISSKPKEDQLIELQSKIVEKYRSKNGSTTKTDDEILALYDIPTKKSINPKWKFWKSSIEDIPQFKSSKERIPLSDPELDKISKNRNRFTNWLFGTGKYHRYYNNWLKTGNSPVFEHNVPIGQWARHLSVSPDGSSASYGNWYRFSPTWATTKISHKNPFGKFSITPMSSIIPSWQYSETEIPEPWFVGESINMNKPIVFKKGGKITKHQDTSIMPGVPDYLKDVWGEIGGQLYQPTMVNVNNPGSSVSSIVQSAISANNGDAIKGDAAREDVNVGPTVVKTNYSVDHAASGKNPTRATSYNYSSIGSQKSDKSPSTGLGWKIAENIAGSVGKAATAYAASKRQMDLVNDMKPFQEQQAPEHSFRYRDSGIDLAYNNAINQQQSYARKFKSSDQALNTAVGLQTADKTAQLELERGLKKAQLFGEQQAQHQNLLQQEAQNRTAVVNRNAERANQMDAYKRQMKGAYIAQNQGIVQGLLSDITGIGQQATAGKKALAAFDAKNVYADNMSGLRTQYQTGVNNGSIASGTSFDDWAMANHKDKIRGWQRDYLATQYQYAKKGGRIRPTSEQIRIDNEKARHKAIAQLSKQAFELLKMALK